jgi:hypothetical protein
MTELSSTETPLDGIRTAGRYGYVPARAPRGHPPWYQPKRRKAEVPMRVYRKVARRLEQPFGHAPDTSLQAGVRRDG